MRCPKCHYLSFEPESRCRNCGYDFSLSADLPVKATETPETPFADIELERTPAPAMRLDRPAAVVPRPVASAVPVPVRESAESASGGVAVAERAVPPLRRREPVRRPGPVPAPTAELPLFVRGMQNAPTDTLAEQGDHELTVPPAPPPLSVRRSTPDAAQMRQKYQAPDVASRKPVADLIRPIERKAEAGPADTAHEADRDLLQILDRPDPPGRLTEELSAESALEIPTPERLIAAVVDGSLLAGINMGVLWLTLRLCELRFANVGELPWMPLLAFMLLVDAGYLLLFTVASGQTVGKMIAGIRVVGGTSEADRIDRLTLSQAALRTALSFPSVLALGAGFVPALVGEGRAVHDRVAETRVVRA